METISHNLKVEHGHINHKDKYCMKKIIKTISFPWDAVPIYMASTLCIYVQFIFILLNMYTYALKIFS